MVGAAARSAGLEWIWVELPNGKQPTAEVRFGATSSWSTFTELGADTADGVGEQRLAWAEDLAAEAARLIARPGRSVSD